MGNIVVALDPNGQNTLKRYGGFDADSGFYILEYMNEKVIPFAIPFEIAGDRNLLEK